MTWKDKLEIGLKDDARFRRDNVPDFQKTGPVDTPPEAERSPVEPAAVLAANAKAGPGKPRTRRRKRETPAH